MLKTKILSIAMSVVTLVSAGCIGVSATELSEANLINNTALFWEEEEAPDCKFYANIDGVVRECTREEYAIYGVLYDINVDGRNVKLNQKEYNEFLRTGIIPDSVVIHEENTVSENEFVNTRDNSRALTMMAKWNFSSLTYPNHIDTSRFNFTAGTTNNRVSLNLRQWRASGSTNKPKIRYQVLQLDSNGDIASYRGEEIVEKYVPNTSGVSAHQIQFNMNASSVNNLIVRVTSQDQYNVSGFGEIYNY